jgi:hypothetical protein
MTYVYWKLRRKIMTDPDELVMWACIALAFAVVVMMTERMI